MKKSKKRLILNLDEWIENRRLNRRIRVAIHKAVKSYNELCLSKIDKLPADDLLELSDGIIRSTSVEVASLVINTIY